MPRTLERAGLPERPQIDVGEIGFSYVCRRCDVWGRIPPGFGRRCWLCERADRLERR